MIFFPRAITSTSFIKISREISEKVRMIPVKIAVTPIERKVATSVPFLILS